MVNDVGLLLPLWDILRSFSTYVCLGIFVAHFLRLLSRINTWFSRSDVKDKRTYRHVAKVNTSVVLNEMILRYWKAKVSMCIRLHIHSV